MHKVCVSVAVTSGMLLAATCAFAQSGPNSNPLGLDYGPFHPPVPPQVTTYIPPDSPAPVALPHRGHHRKARS